MTQLLRNKTGVLCTVLLSIALLGYASENPHNLQKIKELYKEHYSSFEQSVLDEQWWINKAKNRLIGDFLVKQGAASKGYDEFVTDICIPAAYPLFDRKPEDVKKKLQEIGSDDRTMVYIANLINKCSPHSHDINLVARITYDEGKKLELEKIKNGHVASQEEKNTWTGIGLFVKYIVVDKKITV